MWRLRGLLLLMVQRQRLRVAMVSVVELVMGGRPQDSRRDAGDANLRAITSRYFASCGPSVAR